MPRQPRRKSETGIYHIMLRGMNKQTIFEDEQDKIKFTSILKRYKGLCNYQLFAYCLMDNHIHLLLKVESEPGEIIKRLASSYVYWYNWRHKRIGHLFHDRFRSEPVETDQYFLTVLRYIHQNPVKGGLCKQIAEYKYSSYSDYLCTSNLVDTDFCFDILDSKQFVQFNNEYTDETCLDISDARFRLTDEEAQMIINTVCNINDISDFKKIEKKQRDQFLKKCTDNGISIRQLSKLTGLGISTIRRLK